MTDSADARNENHANRTQSGDLLRIVTGAAWQPSGRQSKRFGRLVDQPPDALVSGSGNDAVGLGEIKGRPGRLSDLASLVANFLIQHLNLRRAHVTKL